MYFHILNDIVSHNVRPDEFTCILELITGIYDCISLSVLPKATEYEVWLATFAYPSINCMFKNQPHLE